MLGLLVFAVLLSRIQHVEPYRNSTAKTPASTTVQSSTMSMSSLSSLRRSISTAKPKGDSQCFANEHCLPVLLVIGGLLLACMILMLSTLMLSVLMCLARRRVNALIGSADLDSHKGYRRGSEIEPRVVSVLLADRPHGVTDATEEVKVEEASPGPAERSCSPAPLEEAVV